MVYDSNEQIVVERFTINSQYSLLGFDYDYVYFYNYSTDSGFRANGSIIEVWSGSLNSFDYEFENNDDLYFVSGPSITKNNEEIVSTDLIYYLTTNKGNMWVIGLICMIAIAASPLPEKDFTIKEK